ncbi:MAG TPA: serine/threonine-protein kinase [Hyalangium sp.]|nr:serine/threonine-protein kinase [Hyalangium sp.]
MGKKKSSQEVNPLYLPLGMRVGPWRVTGYRGRGAYGTLYRAERVGHEAEGPFALKLAVYPRDPRFEHEVQLLSRIHSPHVPELIAQGVWEHPSGVYPYLVMQLVDGEPLYEWADRRNPSENQVLRVLAQVTEALEATHAVGGLHRDVKGSNVLVRGADTWAFLTDFGAGHFRGAVTLTSKLLPPGTPAYRSPEAHAFVQAFRRHPTAHYPASTCDDLFALGVTAYRLVTDEYPPSTHPEDPGSEVWREGGRGPRPPRELSPRVSPEMDAFITRLLALAPEERFYGRAKEAAEALKQVAHRTRPLAASPLFVWGYDHLPRVRSPEAERLTAQHDAKAKKALEEREAKEKASPPKSTEPPRRSAFAPPWAAAGAVALLVLVLVLIAMRRQGGEPQADTRTGLRKDRSTSVGDSAMSPALSTPATEPPRNNTSTLSRPLPEKPFPNQRQPPCVPRMEATLRGVCWTVLDMKPPCGNTAYEWEGKCYIPSLNSARQPTSNPPE